MAPVRNVRHVVTSQAHYAAINLWPFDAHQGAMGRDIYRVKYGHFWNVELIFCSVLTSPLYSIYLESEREGEIWLKHCNREIEYSLGMCS